MADRQTDFRFDIYERIVLPDDAAGIGELEEIELTPDIRTQAEAGQNVLKGCLHLTGRYLCVDGGGSQRLEYEIPVEITIPATRSLDMRDLRVEIENFDVDILSKKSLHITGVLALNGLQLRKAGGNDQQKDDEMIFVHHPLQPDQNAHLPIQENWTAAPATEQPFAAPISEQQPVVNQEQLEAVQEISQFGWDAAPYFAAESESEKAGSSTKEDIGKLSRDEQELKVAFSNPGHKPPLAEAEHSKADAPQDGKSSSPDALEWKKLFLHQEQEDRFRKYRICIVQKEETVASIAERYNISARDILHVNKLADEELSEGQVLYIPR